MRTLMLFLVKHLIQNSDTSQCFTTVSSPEQRHYLTRTTLKIFVATLNTQIDKTLVAKCICETMDSVSAAQRAFVLEAFACFSSWLKPLFW